MLVNLEYKKLCQLCTVFHFDKKKGTAATDFSGMQEMSFKKGNMEN